MVVGCVVEIVFAALERVVGRGIGGMFVYLSRGRGVEER